MHGCLRKLLHSHSGSSHLKPEAASAFCMPIFGTPAQHASVCGTACSLRCHVSLPQASGVTNVLSAGAIWTPLLVFDTLTEGYAHDLGEVLPCRLIAAALHGRSLCDCGD